MPIRVLLLADTHLGFDNPLNPRVEKTRRGPDFFANTRRALEMARHREVDLVVHGGDLLYRSKVPRRLVEMALEPLLEVADAGVPVCLVPGNHERSAIPFPLLAAHRGLEIFDRPRTVVLDVRGRRVVIAGFPCVRDRVRSRFTGLIAETAAPRTPADLRLLCLHQTVEGARVGPAGYTFRGGDDVIPGRSIPAGFAAVLAGHIHRAQVVTRDLGGTRLAAPVIYPGSIERTSAAERDEAKGFAVLDFECGEGEGGRLVGHRFHELPTRPMVDFGIDVAGVGADGLAERLRHRLAGLPPDAVVRIEVVGEAAEGVASILRAQSLRALAPPTMIVSRRRRSVGR